MKNIKKAMLISPLFNGICENELDALLGCLGITQAAYKKDQFVIYPGDKPKGIGMVVTGKLHIVREDFLGNREILSDVTEGEIFAETYAIVSQEMKSIAVIATEDATVAYISIEKVLEVCPTACSFHSQIIKNMLKVLAAKNLMLTRKMAHLSKKTIREKLVSYLSEESSRAGSSQFTIPFNRQQLADYLCVERSALSRELSNMQKEGLISFKKNNFLLYNV